VPEARKHHAGTTQLGTVAAVRVTFCGVPGVKETEAGVAVTLQ